MYAYHAGVCSLHATGSLPGAVYFSIADPVIVDFSLDFRVISLRLADFQHAFFMCSMGHIFLYLHVIMYNMCFKLKMLFFLKF